MEPRKSMLPLAIVNRMTWDEVHRWWLCGYLTDEEWGYWQFLWRNSAPRFSDTSERYQLHQE